MPKKFGQQYHIVWSPADKSKVVSGVEVLRKWLDTQCSEWLMSYEEGKNNNPHLDMVVSLMKERRDDKVRESFQRILKDYDKHSVKAYRIDEGRYEWQIGYCVKESLRCFTSGEYKHNLELCREKYNEEIEKYKPKGSDKSWNVDSLVENYVNYLIEEELPHNCDNWSTFKRISRENIKYSVLCKIKLDTLMEYCEMYEVYSYRNTK